MNVLLVNPYIHDFAAYDMWMRPHGLLKIAALLRETGCEISFIDCLDRKDPEIYKFYNKKKPRQDPYDCGKFPKTQIDKPAAIKDVPRRYYRYGIPVELFKSRLAAANLPDIILATSVMTYWYSGVRETINILKEHFPSTPVLLGGIYPAICPEHAKKYSGADFIFRGGTPREVLTAIFAITGIPICQTPDITPPPAYDLLKRNNAAALQTSYGCPFSCAYCASKTISLEFVQRDISEIIAELAYYDKLGIKNIAFYDDALLYKPETHFIPLMEKILERKFNFNFHTPNGLHARFLNSRVASLMNSCGFKTIRLSLETSSAERQSQTGGKVTNDEFRNAVVNLNKAGISSNRIDVYLLVGSPGQTFAEVKEDINFVHALGAKAMLASYSAIPGTRDWQTMVSEGKIPPDLDPVRHNHTIFPSINEEFSVEKVRQLRQETAKLN